MKQFNSHTKILLLISVAVIITVSLAFKPGRPQRNLTVLPKDISPQKLDSIMQSYTVALGVSCSFCHVKDNNSPDSINYVSDAEPMKDNAREMMRMTIAVNTRYFYFDKTVKPEYLNVIHCKTCHRGEPIPVNN
jgi:hypothetical protein